MNEDQARVLLEKIIDTVGSDLVLEEMILRLSTDDLIEIVEDIAKECDIDFEEE